MNFTIYDTGAKAPRLVRLETDLVRLPVGEISFDKGAWRFHHHEASGRLTPKGTEEMLKVVNDKVVVLNITARLLK